MWKSSKLLSIDVETTGFDARTDRVIEVGWCLIENGLVYGAKSQLVDPKCPIPPKITEITGITDADVQGQPSIKDVLEHEIAPLMKDCFAVVAYNAPFDEGFVNQEAMRNGVMLVSRPWLDPCAWMFGLNGRPFKLAQACTQHGVELANAHRAMGDIVATANLTLRLMPVLPELLSHILSQQQSWQASHNSWRKSRSR